MISMGCDVGALFTKAVVLDDGELIGSRVVRTTGVIGQELDRLFGELLAEHQLDPSVVTSFGATGRGAAQVRGAHFTENEHTCAAAAAAYCVPGVELVIHMGGQSVSAMTVDAEGAVGQLVRNDKCAAGTGRFLEMVSHRFNFGVDQIDALVSRSASPAPISDQCVVFAESELISQLNQGVRLEDVLAGVCNSVGRMVAAQGRRLAVGRSFTLTGGVARLSSVVQVVEELLPGKFAPFAGDPWLAPALGAALLEEYPEDGHL